MTIFDEPEEHSIASHYVSMLINGDTDDYSNREIRQFNAWLQDAQDNRMGHWSYPDEEEYDNFTTCSVTGLQANCTTVTFHPIKES